MNAKENFIRNATLSSPEYTPATVYISPASVRLYGDEMEQVARRYPQLISYALPHYEQDAVGEIFLDEPRHVIDAFGCEWVFNMEGLDGIVVNHPLSDWNTFDAYRMPDPNQFSGLHSVNWKAEEKRFATAGPDELKVGGIYHGFLMLRTQYLRGFENMMIDIGLQEPRLSQLLDKIEQYTTAVIARYLNMGADLIQLPEDLGTQNRLIMGPPHFRRLIKPVYQRLVALCDQHGALTHVHSDGYVMEIADDLIECGFTIVNHQDLCNGIDNLKRAYKGKVCIDLDIDRQSVVPFGTPAEIDDLIETEAGELGSPQGGLSFIAGIYPPTPPQNVEALCKALLNHKDRWLK